MDALDALDALELDALELDALELDPDRVDPPTLDESSSDILYNTMGRHGNLWGKGARNGNYEMCSLLKQLPLKLCTQTGVGQPRLRYEDWVRTLP